MANDGTINLVAKIYNATPKTLDFFLFAEKPKVSESPKVFQNAYLSQNVPSGGIGTFKFPYTLDAICGHQKLGYGTMIDESQTKPITLGTKMDGGTVADVILNRELKMAEFGANAVSNAVPGTFRITIGGDSHINDPFYVGIASPNTDGDIVPTCVFEADPKANYTLTPHMIYWISVGSFKPGVIVDVGEAGPKQILDFTGGNPELVYTFNSDGKYSVGPPKHQ